LRLTQKRDKGFDNDVDFAEGPAKMVKTAGTKGKGVKKKDIAYTERNRKSSLGRKRRQLLGKTLGTGFLYKVWEWGE